MRISDPHQSSGYSSRGFRKTGVDLGDAMDPNKPLWVGNMMDQIEAVKQQREQQIPESEILQGLMMYEGLPENVAREIMQKAKGEHQPPAQEEPVETGTGENFGIAQPLVQEPWSNE